MAWTTTKTAEYCEGNQRVQLWYLIADAATLELDTGLDYVNHIGVAIATFTTTTYSFKRNVNSTNVAANGQIAITGCTSADEMFVTVYGR